MQKSTFALFVVCLMFVLSSPVHAKPKACICPTVYAPVKATNGKTYNNACLARCAGAKIAKKLHFFNKSQLVKLFKRAKKCPKYIAKPCPPGFRRQKILVKGCYQPGPCGARGNSLRIIKPKAKPCMCPMIFAPVCGVDKKNYPNSCAARCKNVKVLYKGKCRTKPCPTYKIKACVKKGTKRTFTTIRGCQYPGPCVSVCKGHKCSTGKVCKVVKHKATCVCPTLKCPSVCVYGSYTKHGCPTCRCRKGRLPKAGLPYIPRSGKCKRKICPMGKSCKIIKGKETCVCPPVCLLYCKHGLVEKNGCLICKCRTVNGTF